MAVAVLELCHDYFRKFVYFHGSPTVVLDQHYQDKTPAVIYLEESGMFSLGYAPRWEREIKKVEHIFDSNILVSDCVVQWGDTVLSGEDIAVKFLEEIKCSNVMLLNELVDLAVIIVPNSYHRASYIWEAAGKQNNIEVKCIRACDALALAYAVDSKKMRYKNNSYFSTVHMNYFGIDRTIHTCGNHVLCAERVCSKQTGYIDRFIELLVADFFKFGKNGEQTFTDRNNLKIRNAILKEARQIAKKEPSKFPYTISNKSIMKACKAEKIQFTWDQITKCAEKACENALPAFDLPKERETLQMDKEDKTVVVSGEGTDYPALTETIFSMLKKDGYEPVSYHNKSNEMQQITRYVSENAEDLILMNTMSPITLKTSNAQEIVINANDILPNKHIFELPTHGAEHIAVVIMQEDEPILWGKIQIPSKDLNAITVVLDANKTGLLSGAIYAGENTVNLQYEGVLTNNDVEFLLREGTIPFGRKVSGKESHSLGEASKEIREPSACELLFRQGIDFNSLYRKAVDLVFLYNKAEISFLQETLSLGYAVAAKLIHKMEADHIISPYAPGKKRTILMTRSQWERTLASPKDRSQESEQL